MKNLARFVGILAVATFAAMQAQAQLISETFSYGDGALTNVSGGLWAAHSGTSVQQFNESGGAAQIVPASGTDVNRLIGGITHTADVLYASFDLTMSASQLPTAAGTYFIHFKNSGSFFDPRVWAVLDGSGFKLGIANGSNGSAVGSPLWATSLSAGTTYRVVFSIDQTGANLASQLWVDPADIYSTSIMATDTLASGTDLIAIALRQSTGSGTMAIDNLLVDTTAAGVGLIPEPSTIMLLGTGLLGLLAIRRRRS